MAVLLLAGGQSLAGDAGATTGATTIAGEAPATHPGATTGQTTGPTPGPTPGPTTWKAPSQFACKGIVVDSADKPVAGATVAVYRSVRKYFEVRAETFRLAQFATKGDGVFAFDGSADPASVAVVAEKDGLAIGWANLTGTQVDGDLKVTLAQASTLAGAVVDEKGSAVEGAKVEMMLSPGEGSWNQSLSGRGQIGSLTRTTDKEGRFSFGNVSGEQSAVFQVTAEGKATLNTMRGRDRTGFAPPAGDIKLTLQPEGRIEITVTDARTGKPVGDAVMMVHSWRGGGGAAQLARCVSKEEGRYVFENLAAGPCMVSPAQPADAPAAWAAPGESFDVKPGKAVTAKIQVCRGGVIEVSVTEGDNGRPIGDANINVSSGRRFNQAAFTGGDGLARIRLAPGDYGVGWVSAYGYSQGGPGNFVKLEDGKTVRLEFKLNKLATVRGTVSDGEGKPLAGVDVRVLPDYQTFRTDPSGAFDMPIEFQRWSFLKQYLVLARQAKGGLAAAAVIADASKPVNFKLRPGLTVTGRAVSADGKPVANAAVAVLMGQTFPGTEFAIARDTADSAGRFEVHALPAGQRYALRVSGKDCCTADLALASPGADGRIDAGDVALAPARHAAAAPAVKSLAIPAIPGGWAIWGATGRDDRGHVWFSVTAHEVKQPSAHLFEYVPRTGELFDRGDVVSELKKAGVLREGEGQMKIHTKIVQAADGWLYFASMDEEGEEEATEKLPTWGGHLWRLRPGENKWEHLLTTKEPLIALAGGGRYVYTMGYWGHTLFQYDTRTAAVRSVKVGATEAHVSRNIVVDAHEHIYVPRVGRGPDGEPTVALVELDESLKELGQTLLKFYFNDRFSNAHGITGVVRLPDGSMIFTTHNGWLTRIVPSAAGAAKVSDVGWMYPAGPTYVASLFADSAGRQLMAAVPRGRENGYEWVTRDLQTGQTTVAPLRVGDPKGVSLEGALLYGCQTRDDLGNYYVVGAISPGFRMAHSPAVLVVQPAPETSSSPSTPPRPGR